MRGVFDKTRLFLTNPCVITLRHVFGSGCVILILISAGIYSAVQRNDYEWRWTRIPQYFFYKDETLIKAPFDGTVLNISESSSKKTTISLRSETGELVDFDVDSGTVRVNPNDLIIAGDIIGFTVSWRIGPMIFGFWTTIWVSATASVFGLLIGLVTGLMKISKNYTVRNLAAIYIEIIRGTPLLVQIFIAYFFFAGIGALALFAGAYVAEIIRAGIQSIPRGQMEAARSLGMSTAQAMIDIILPQAFKRVLPPLAGQFISLIKDSSLLSIIAIIDLVKTGREIIATTFSPFEIWLLVAAIS
jgi:polar amino acid transport system permease protein